mgnify:CR=1 FL=1
MPEDKKEVVIELDDKGQPVKPPEVKKEEPKYASAEDIQKINDAIRNTREWNTRKISSFEEKLDNFIASQAPKEPEKPADEWEEKLNKDWKGTVRELSRIEVQEILKAEREIERKRVELEHSTQLLESNKQKVLERHPELEDMTSEKARVYQQVINENPSYISNSFGPVLAMRDMEDRLRADGKFMDAPAKKAIDKEVERRGRVGATAVKPGANGTGNEKVVLTKEDREFCDQNNIKYERYASMKKRSVSKEGVEA